MLANKIKAAIRDIPDYPKPGILFKDITPLLADPDLITNILEEQSRFWGTKEIHAVAAVEARGFIFGALLAHELKCPFVPIRKKGKLPYQCVAQEYDLEYGTASIEMHIDAIKPGWRVLIHDDLLATGGTAAAAGNLIKKLGGTVAGFSFLVNLSFLPGKNLLKEKFEVDPFYMVEF